MLTPSIKSKLSVLSCAAALAVSAQFAATAPAAAQSPTVTELRRAAGTTTPSTYGDLLRFDVSVGTNGGEAPTGSVVLYDDQTELTSASLVSIGTGQTIAAGQYSSCVMTPGGGVTCWGDNGDGQLGNGNFSNSGLPVAVSGLTNNVRAISMHPTGTHVCALLNTGGVRCWGAGGWLGDGTTASSNVPVDVFGLTNAIAISAGMQAACAVLSTGSVMCWGNNQFLGDGDGTDTTRKRSLFAQPGAGHRY